MAGYVLMPEHVHLLGRDAHASPPLPCRCEAANIKEVEEARRGPLLAGRYYDFNVWTEQKAVEKLKYMHRNPVQRGLVATPEDWPWSSFRHYITGEQGTVEIESHWTARRREVRETSSIRAP